MVSHWTLPVTLSKLQVEGVGRLRESRASILADPPGAGKTWTTLGVIAQDSNVTKTSRILVVAPNQVLEQWKEEMEKISNANQTCVRLLYPKSNRAFRELDFSTTKGESLALFLSPGILVRVAKLLSRFKLTHAVFDEVHLYSRPRTKGWSALHTVCVKVTQRILFLTANPI
jgi:superfamily II DNA or RNA helicase